LDYDFNLGKISYPDSLGRQSAGAPDPADYSLDFQTHSVGLFIRLKRNMGIGLTAGRWIRNAPLLGQKSDRNFIFGSLTTDF
jgi:hypothetical protein